VRALAAIESADDIRMRINTALDAVAERLGNTRAVCRKYYVHPAILLAYERQELDRYVRRARRRDGARWEEHVVMDVLTAT
jgi:DNA topoisomerase-1